jgi:hypothetical protein
MKSRTGFLKPYSIFKKSKTIGLKKSFFADEPSFDYGSVCGISIARVDDSNWVIVVF